MIKISLPIDALLPDIEKELSENNTLILQATPGAGKTTRVPPCLLHVVQKNILVLEPRRLAAKLSAQRVAQERQEECGDVVGYVMRYEKKESKKTRLKFMTEGLFLRLILSDPNLSEVDCVILDEFHERHLHTDVTLMLVRLLQKTTRPNLKLIVMSATLEVESLHAYLPEAKILVCETKNYPVSVEYLPQNDTQKNLDIKVLLAVERILKNPKDDGDILVFLPGRQDISRCAQKLSEIQTQFQFMLFSLSADTNAQDQQQIFNPQCKRKIILSTNVAETSLTIEGVTYVIDSGLAKCASHTSWSGFSTLELKPISKSSCQQRMGRAGRTKPGHCLRLFTQYDYNLRPQFETPEIQRVDLTQIYLELKNLDVGFHESDPWFDAPARNKIDYCRQLLTYLHALDKNNELTEIGKKMVSYPYHPRLSRILIEAKKLNIFPQTLPIVFLLSEGMIFKKNISPNEYSHSDIHFQLKILKDSFIHKNLSPSSFSLIDKTQLKNCETGLQHMSALFKVPFSQMFEPLTEKELSLVLFSGFLDRVCQVRLKDEKNKKLPEYNLGQGGGAVLHSSSTAQDEEFILALVAEEVVSKAQAYSTQIQFCHGIEKSLLLERGEEFLSQKKEVFWNSEKKSVACVNRTYYGKLVLKEEIFFGEENEIESILMTELKKSWPLPFEDDLPLQYFNERLSLAEQAKITVNCPKIAQEELELFLCFICEGKKSFSQICEKNLNFYIDEFIGYENIHKLNSLLPSHIVVGQGQKIPIHYDPGKPPWVSSRLQDFFGTTQTPKILNGQINLVVHLLAPNRQAVQVTHDLAGFWERGYLEVKKALSRKYPRHSWPDDPKNAEPPELTRKKRTP